MLFVPQVAGRGERCLGCNGRCDQVLDSMVVVQQAHNRETLAGRLTAREVAATRATQLSDMRKAGCTFGTDQILRLFAQIAGDGELQRIANEFLDSPIKLREEDK